MNKAYKFRLYPTDEQRIMLAKTFGCVRFIYNKMLDDKIKHYEQTKENLYCYPSQYKAEFEWLKEVDSLALNSAYNNLQSAYGNFFRDKKIGFPKFKSKKNSRQSYTTNIMNGNIRIENGYLKLPKIGFVKMKQHREIPENYTLKSVTVSKTPSGKYFASLLFEFEQEIQSVKAEKETTVAIHYTNRNMFLDSNGFLAGYEKYYSKLHGKLAKEQRKFSKMKLGSSNRKKQRIKVAKIHEKISNCRNDFQHKLSHEYSRLYSAVITDGFSMKEVSKSLWLGKSTNDNAYGSFKIMLEYKLKEQGKQMIKAPADLPISITCSCCKQPDRTVALDKEEWRCGFCGVEHNREYNAVRNLLAYGLEQLELA